VTAPATLDRINDFPGLLRYLHDELEWEIPEDAAFGDLTFNWTPSEIGLDLDEPIEITQLRPLRADQRWGVFFLNFPHGKLPVTLMRRILRGLSKRKRASANASDRAAWDKDDLIFISAVGDADDRRLSFAHFQDRGNDLPTLRVIGWDKDDTVRRLSHTDQVLRSKLGWLHGEGLPLNWRDAFTERPRESVRTAKEMAEALAALARDIRDRIKLILPKEKANGDLKQLFEAVKQTLSRDLDAEKFADTYAQTIAYGLLSARINQVRERDEKHEASPNAGVGTKPALPEITAEAAGQAMPTTNPFLKELFGSFLSAGGRDATGAGLDFDELGVGEVVDLLNAADMEAVLLDFDKHKAGDDPVIHFYEGFLHAYDKALKVQRGVFYTPQPVVSFIVRSVDEVLRTEFGLADGLADVTTWSEFVAGHPETMIPAGVKGDEHFVKILDPATGTGTFLVEVIDLIHATMTKKWKSTGLDDKARAEAWNTYVPQHLLPRLYGYELMMAPYAVAHMKLGLKLADTGYRFEGVDANGKPARARVFLTNALEPARNLDMELSFMSEALAHEAKAANESKDKARFTVVVGNPPYKGDSANPSRINGRLTPAGELIQHYFRVDGQPLGEKTSKWINNDYVKFIGFGERVIGSSGVGVIGYITSNSWLDGVIFRGVRASLVEKFEHLWIVDLHGNINKRERAPDGSPDDGVFEILEGTNVTIGACLSGLAREVRHVDIQGEWPEHPPSHGKRLWVESHSLGTADMSLLEPTPPQRALVAAHGQLDTGMAAWPSIKDVLLLAGAGMTTARDHFAIDLDPSQLLARIESFRDSTSTIVDALESFSITNKEGWDGNKARLLLRQSGDLKRLLTSISFSPLDFRWTIYSDAVIWRTARPVMEPIMVPGNVGLVTTRQTKDRWGILATNNVIRHKAVSAYDISSLFPLYHFDNGTARSNVAAKFTARLEALTGLRFDDGFDAPMQGALPGTEPPSPEQGSLALRRGRGDLTTTFGARDVFDWIYSVLHSPAYRERYAEFLRSNFARVPLPHDRALLAALVPLGTELVALHLLDPVAAPILADPAVRFVNPNGVEARLDGRKADARRNAAGRVYVNDASWFETVPASVWDRWIGGYQPAQKWLKDRAAKGGKNKREGRVLTAEDQLHYRRMITALGRTAELMVEIDAVIARHGGWPDAFRGMAD
jgi:type I restriction-modification system DNA methylase subunit